MNDKQQLASMGEHTAEMADCKPEFKVPDGWKLVPEVLTDEMEDAAYKELGSPSDWYSFDEAYRVMILVAPEYKP